MKSPQAEKTPALSPLMKQYYEIKANYPDCILFYRVGDFYETFSEDAIKVSKALGLVLTRKAAGNNTYTELAGVPHHALESYLPKLVKAGYKVAVCDQLEDPKLTKKIVKRGVTELVTPGVAYNDSLLNQKENNFVAACSFEKDRAGVAFLDISTGTFKAAQGSLDYIDVLIQDFAPKEILLQREYVDGFRRKFGERAYISPLEEWAFNADSARKKLLQHFGSANLKGFGIDNLPLAVTAAGAILFYLEITEHHDLGHIRTISRIDRDGFMWIDRFTQYNLEIFAGTRQDSLSLTDVLDCCSSPMGSRKMREWLAMPLKDSAAIARRHDVVECLVEDCQLREELRGAISDIGDLERIVSKAAAARLLPREALQLGRGLVKIAEIIQKGASTEQLRPLVSGLESCDELAAEIAATLRPDAATAVGKGEVVASGVDPELDQLRDILNNSKQILLDIQQREKERTGIASLKVSYNNVFGYYLEVRNMYSDKVPQEWIRKQTLVGAERYITPELKSYEEKILGAEEKILAIETCIYGALVAAVQAKVAVIQSNAQIVAQLDVLASFAATACEKNYCRPTVDDSYDLDIKGGRHPVIEALMPAGEEYIANDLYLDCDSRQVMILTGPNMAGKSAFLRQSALIVLMAQVGSFVPANEARIGVVDKLFTRVGASDNISRGESTFMVEMLEAATILNNLSQRSLVLFDEIGRGTSTFDGMSIAWGIVEYLCKGAYRPKTLFATHYHELNELETMYPSLHNYHISTREIDGKVIFLRKLCEGGVAKSFGIHVARMAGMPLEVVQAAESKLRTLEENQEAAPAVEQKAPKKEGTPSKPVQLTLYQLDDPLLVEIREELHSADINKMSPLDAFDLLRKLKNKIG